MRIPASRIEELGDKRDDAFLSFWRDRHPLPLEDAGFDPDDSNCRVITESREDGKILSAVVFIPVWFGGIMAGHTCYIASLRRSKALVSFCLRGMKGVENHPGFSWLNIETRQNPDLRVIEKLARRIGFSEAYCPDHGWTDFVWNSKARKEQSCHQ